MSTIVILAGGRSRRMGRDKLALEFRGETLLRAAAARFSPQFDRVYLSLADEDRYPEVAAERVRDLYPGQGPMAGLHAGLSRTPDDAVFLLAADLPLATPEAAAKIISLTGAFDACAVRSGDGKLEPLFACYKKSLLPELDRSLAAGDRKMSALLLRVRARLLSPAELGGAWRGDLLANINRPEDYARLISGK
jgi:molybdopterin-guanine dinucleotide biosynthesis protein A